MTKSTHNITADKILKAIAESKFAKTCIDKDHAFDIVVEDVKLEVSPSRWSYGNGAVAYGKGWYESEYIYFNVY